MAKKREIDITINEDGTVEFDQMGYEGAACANDIEDLLKAVGKETDRKKKREYNKDQKVRLSQPR